MAQKDNKRRSKEHEHRKSDQRKNEPETHETVEGSRAQGAAGEAGGQEDREKK